MVKLTAVHYGLDDASFSQSLNQQIATKESGEYPKEKSKEKTKNKPIGGGLRQGKKKKAKLENGIKKRPSRTKARTELTCNNCGELFETVQSLNQHKSQDSC